MDDSPAEALRKIETKSLEHWGPDSMWTRAGTTVPFVPFLDDEMLAILQLRLNEFESRVKQEVTRALDAYKKSHAPLQPVWRGDFEVSSQVKRRLVDALHMDSLKKNARAISNKLWVSLQKLVYDPEPIGDRLTQMQCTDRSSKTCIWVLNLVLEMDENGLLALAIRGSEE